MKILPIIILLFGLNVQAQQKSIVEYWNETSLNDDYFNSFFTTKSCVQNGKSLVGCMEALQWLKDFVDPNLDLDYMPRISGTGTSGIWALAFSINSEKKATGIESIILNKKELYHNLIQDYNKRMIQEKGKMQISNLKIEMNSLLGRVPEEKLKYAQASMINQFLSNSVDAHTYIIPKEFQANREKVLQKGVPTVGLGLSYLGVNKGILVTEVAKDSAADRVQIEPGDIILSIDQISLLGVDKKEIFSSENIGEIGEKRFLEVLKPSGKVVDLHLTFKSYSVENVTLKYFETNTGEAALIRFGSFADSKSCEKIKNYLEQINKKNIDHLILDLRNNGGGLLDQARCIGGLFVGKKEICSAREVGNVENILESYTSNEEKLYYGKLSILQNGSSASASELLASALRDYDRALIFGQKSYGKGSIQSEFKASYELDKPLLGINFKKKYTLDDILLKQTSGRFYSPSGHSVQILGVVPDVQLSNDLKTEKEPPFIREVDRYLYPLKIRDPYRFSDAQRSFNGKMKKCLLDRKEDIITYMLLEQYVYDYELAQVLFRKECE